MNPDWEFGVDYDIALLPGPEAGQTGSSNGGWQLAISKESEHKEEACEFLAFVTAPDMMALGDKDHIPTRLSSQEAEYFTGDPFVEKSLEQAAYGLQQVGPDALLHGSAFDVRWKAPVYADAVLA